MHVDLESRTSSLANHLCMQIQKVLQLLLYQALTFVDQADRTSFFYLL